MAFPTVYHTDSDADDEYERSVMTSPILPTDDDASTTDSDPPSTQHTPTTFGNGDYDRLSPRTILTEWTTDECADYITSLGLAQYCDKFLENEIVGEALIALKHEELKEMGIISVGHRLTILKGIYDVKVKQDIPIEADHYIPLSADASVHDKTATQEDISRIIHSIKLRDERILQAETELRKMTEEYRKLRAELLPVFRMAKDRSQPLPYQPSAASPDFTTHEGMSSPVTLGPPPEKTSKIHRALSKKGGLWLNATPKTNSPTHNPHTIPEHKSTSDNANLDPSAAAVAASSHLTASINGGSQPSNSPNQTSIPSPTSPSTYHNQTISTTRGYSSREGNRDGSTPSTGRTLYSYDELPHTSYNSQAPLNDGRRYERSNPTPTPGRARGQTRDMDDSASTTTTAREAPSVEIFKAFRVSVEDPCYKVLPAALKKYNINADWRQYALYIVFGDQERCLGLEEKPLILFKQLDKEGRKPMFMLRRHAAPIEGHSGPTGSGGIGSAGFESSNNGGLGSSKGHQSSIQLPGGVI